MSAEERLAVGDLAATLAALQDQIRKNSADPKLRVFLFQLLCVLGQWDRSMTQLAVCGELDASALAMVQTYREALKCENLRAAAFAGSKAPLVFGQPAQWIALLLQALKHTAQEEFEQAQRIREEAFEQAPAVAGRIDGQAFEWIADADMRLGPLLEAIVNGRYYWVPFHRIKEIRLEKPSDLRDRVWTPAYFTWANGGKAAGLIPTRYPGSEASEDPKIRLASKTEWLEKPFETFLGLGQRQLATDVGEFALMDIRQIELDTSDSAEAEAADG